MRLCERGRGEGRERGERIERGRETGSEARGEGRETFESFPREYCGRIVKDRMDIRSQLHICGKGDSWGCRDVLKVPAT